MTDHASILAQADALIRKRRRAFVANATEKTAPVAEAEDVPTLTETVTDEAEAVADLVDLIASTSDTRLAQALQRRADLLEAALEEWLQARLPQLIEGALANIAPRMVEDVTAQARMELHACLLEAMFNGRQSAPSKLSSPTED